MSDTIKLDDLPPELLERCIPDLRPETVSELRLVNRRFRDVFSADRFYKPYVRFGTTPVDCEEEGDSGGDAGGGEESSVRKGPWRRCLETEKRCLENWKNGRAERAYAVEIPSEEIQKLSPPCPNIFWQGLVGQRGDHWLLAELEENSKIALVCATGSPVLTVIDVSPHTRKPSEFAFLLPDQVLIDTGGTGCVFNIVNHGEYLSLEYFFQIGQIRGGLCSNSPPVSRSYRSLYVVLSGEYDVVLRVWDLKRAVRLDDIVLPDLLPTEAFDFGQTCRVNASQVEHPLVLVTIDFDLNEGLLRSGKRAYMVVDVEKGLLKFWCREDRASYVEYCRFSDNVFLLNLFTGNHFHLRVFGRNYLTTDLRQTPVLFQHRSQEYFHVHCDSSTVVLFITDEIPPDPIRKILVVKVAPAGISQFEIDVGAMNYAGQSCINDCSVVGPFFVVKCAEELLSLDFTGEILFDWKDLLRSLDVPSAHENFRIANDDVEFNSISKCVLQYSSGEKLLICYF